VAPQLRFDPLPKPGKRGRLPCPLSAHKAILANPTHHSPQKFASKDEGACQDPVNILGNRDTAAQGSGLRLLHRETNQCWVGRCVHFRPQVEPAFGGFYCPFLYLLLAAPTASRSKPHQNRHAIQHSKALEKPIYRHPQLRAGTCA